MLVCKRTFVIPHGKRSFLKLTSVFTRTGELLGPKPAYICPTHGPHEAFYFPTWRCKCSSSGELLNHFIYFFIILPGIVLKYCIKFPEKMQDRMWPQCSQLQLKQRSRVRAWTPSTSLLSSSTFPSLFPSVHFHSHSSLFPLTSSLSFFSFTVSFLLIPLQQSPPPPLSISKSLS